MANIKFDFLLSFQNKKYRESSKIVVKIIADE